MNRTTLSVISSAAVLAVGVFIAACSSSPPPEVPTDVSFASDTVLAADVTSMNVTVQNVPARDYPHVGHRSPVTFEQAARKWADARFNMTGNSVNALRIIVKEGDITESLLDVKTGFTGAFKKEQAAKYEARLEVALEILDPDGKVLTSGSAKSFNSQTVPEDATEADKQIVWVGMVKKAFDSLDQELIPQLRQGMSTYMR